MSSNVIPYIRIRKIVLTDFRNIAHAEVDIPGGKIKEFMDGGSSVLGLYGQNGSGKTSLIMAIYALKCALSGRRFLVKDFASCIRSGCNSSKLEFEFSAYNDSGLQFDLYYSFKISIDDDEDAYRDVITDTAERAQKIKAELIEYVDKKRIVITDEVLQFAATSAQGKKSNKQVLIDTTEDSCRLANRVFGNKKKYEELTCNSRRNGLDIDIFLLKAKYEAEVRSTSFIFTPKVVKTFIRGSSKTSYKLILDALRRFGTDNLFTITMYENSANSSSVLLLSAWIKDEEYGSMGYTFPFRLDKSNPIPEDFFHALEYTLNSISRVLSSIVPGLSVGFEKSGTKMARDGNMIEANLIAVRNGVKIPLAYESEGIRRIISFLSLMTAIYNNPGVTLAIDEIDSGIFEYMLGELISIMHQSAKGQLIFTSHNLRPLEVLPYSNLLFTTVNPQKRFTKLEGISGNNNLRDSYFRSIILGSGKDAFYDATDTFNIEQAFLKAGLHQE